MRNLIALFTAAFALALSVPAASANLIINSDGKLIGATGVNVGGTLYDVEFGAKTCTEVYGACNTSDFTFQTKESALLAAQALLDQVFVGPPASPNCGTIQYPFNCVGIYDANPSLTLGCDLQFGCVVIIPYQVTISPAILAGTAYNDTGAADGVATSFQGQNSPPASGGMWPRFTLSGSVPEPATWAMMLLGFGGIGLAMRRRKPALA